MDQTVMLFREHRGALADSMETLTSLEPTLSSLCQHLRTLPNYTDYVRLNESNVRVQLYDDRPDNRIGWPKTYVVQVKQRSDEGWYWGNIGFTNKQLIDKSRSVLSPRSFQNVRIISEGEGFGTRTLLETGEEIHGVVVIDLCVKPGDPVKAEITLMGVAFESVVKKPVYKMAHPITGELLAVKSITFEDSEVADFAAGGSYGEVKQTSAGTCALSDAQLTELEKRLIVAEIETEQASRKAVWVRGPATVDFEFKAQEYVRRLIDHVKAIRQPVTQEQNDGRSGQDKAD